MDLREMKIFRLIYSFGLFLILLVVSNAKGYDELLFKPLTANVFEPRVGALYQFQDKKLRLDIGTSIDLFDFKHNESNQFRLGTDFFTFTRLRSEGNFKFPVETSDYFFGVNATTAGMIDGTKYFARLRVAHISSHMVDGLAHDSILSSLPFIYSREFVDLTGAVPIGDLRFYLGLTYVFSKLPKITNAFVPECGFDANYAINGRMDFVGGYDFKLTGYDNKYFGVHSAQAGILFKTSGNLGLMIDMSIYEGKSMHGMFFMDNDSYVAIGFQVIFY
jgi:hypothetical protein